MPIPSDVIRGHTDTIILAHLIRADSYGYRINKEIQKKTGNRFELKEATLYSAFRRLEKEGYITSYWGDEEQGARRRYYRITTEGKAAWKRNRKEWDEAKDLIDALTAAKGGK